MKKFEIYHSDEAPKALGPYSQATQAGNFLFLSGQLPIDPSNNQVITGGIEEQTSRCLKNLFGVLKAAGLSSSHIVKTTVFLKNIEDFPKFNETYQKHFEPPYPARATVEIARLYKDVLIEIDAIAVTTM